ncbi:hypothetical protein JCM5350_005341 [Sporobolomyces pararoseus]
MGDIWIKADYPIGPFAQQPIEQAVADVLAKAPWAAWQTGEVAFRYEYIDRPEAGTALLALLSPPTRPAPNDGLRYLVPDSTERRTVTHHTVACPVSITAPTQNQPIQVELECYTSFQGHLPPTSRDQILPPNSPELRLTRFRKRWRITNGQYPALWFFWWGRDDSGGTGSGTSQPAPVGWDRTPVRSYPIVRDPSMPTAAVYPFPGPGRLPGPNTTASGGSGGGGGLGGQPGQGSNQAGGGGGADPRQAYLVQQHQQQLIMQQQARAQALAASQAAAAAGGNVPLGYNLTPAQMQQAQLLNQQQAQQRLAAQQQQSPYATQARGLPPQQTQTPSQGRKPTLPSHASLGSSAQPSSLPPSSSVSQREPILDSTTPTVDVLDVLTSRQLAIHRLTLSQDSLAPIFDPWSTSEILAGQKRKREVEEAMKSETVDTRTGESLGGIAGFGREHALTILATSAARVSVHAGLGKDVKKATFSLEERKQKLSAMLEKIKQETESMEKKHKEAVTKLTAKPV